MYAVPYEQNHVACDLAELSIKCHVVATGYPRFSVMTEMPSCGIYLLWVKGEDAVLLVSPLHLDCLS
jgi:hypothetical protein